jgi:hypothetical protein
MKKTILAAVGFAFALPLMAVPADAKGCGGYVNMAVWGCAPWDNNPPKRGVTPGYPAAKPAPQPVRQVVQQPAKPAVQPAGAAGIINPANTSSSLISNKAGGVINPANTSSSLISNKAGGVINPANTSSSLINQQNTSSSFKRQ